MNATWPEFSKQVTPDLVGGADAVGDLAYASGPTARRTAACVILGALRSRDRSTGER